ncbi:polysaccharide biosynthesis/export family protein [bacterium]|nr:polysaccharide biosynthesis/export family protein [bacterium]
MLPTTLNTEESDRSYTLGPGDELSVIIRGKGGFQKMADVVVLPQGTVVLPMLDDVEAMGLTPDQFSSKVAKLLEKDYLVSPSVVVTLMKRRSHKVTLVGEFDAPGTYYLQAETELLRDVVIRAGGPKGGLDKTVVLIRPAVGPQGELDSAPERYTAGLIELMTKHVKAAGIPVKAGDIIYLLSGEQASEMGGKIIRSVLVSGQVRKPGFVPYSKGLTVLRAILKAGNFLEGAAKSRVAIKRTIDGKVTTIKVNINRITEGGDKSADVLLQPGDIVYVPRSLF